MKISTRVGVVKRAMERNHRSMSYLAKSSIGLVMWMARPRTRSIVHNSHLDSCISPMGARWVRMFGSDVRLCSHCRSMHPMDFLDALDGLTRWSPKHAHAELAALIERGEIQNSLSNQMRHMHVGEGSVLLDVINAHQPMIAVTAHTWRHVDHELVLVHLADIPDAEYERFREWASEMLPEIELSDRDGIKLAMRYLSEVDPMVGIPPIPTGLVLIRDDEEPHE